MSGIFIYPWGRSRHRDWIDIESLPFSTWYPNCFSPAWFWKSISAPRVVIHSFPALMHLPCLRWSVLSPRLRIELGSQSDFFDASCSWAFFFVLRSKMPGSYDFLEKEKGMTASKENCITIRNFTNASTAQAFQVWYVVQLSGRNDGMSR